jgi:formamidopyrimidine-DNA glycosylase
LSLYIFFFKTPSIDEVVVPELPEVETVMRGLELHIIGKSIEEVVLRRPDLRIPFPPLFAQRLQDRRILGLTRRAKYILIALEDDLIWLIHLGMSGSVRLVQADVIARSDATKRSSQNNDDVSGLLRHDIPRNDGYKKHDHVIVRLSGGLSMIYHDPRRFGLMSLMEKDEMPEHPLLAHLGAEPLEDAFDAVYLAKVLAKKTIPIKQAIMDQQVVVGVGNIYASESLFRSRIHPQTPANEVKALGALVVAIKDVLCEAIASGGSTLRDYVNVQGETGYFQHAFDVYGREHVPCTHCGTPIRRITQQGRSTFFCGECQK